MNLHWSIPVTTAGLIVGTALYFSVPANADTGTDAAFLATLSQQGISAVNGGAELIQIGHGICTLRAAGMSETQAMTLVYSKAPLTAYEAGYFVGASEAAYCPQYFNTSGGGNAAGIQTGTTV